MRLPNADFALGCSAFVVLALGFWHCRAGGARGAEMQELPDPGADTDGAFGTAVSIMGNSRSSGDHGRNNFDGEA
jgi:hypothetical protein